MEGGIFPPVDKLRKLPAARGDVGPDPQVASGGDSRGAGSELALMQFLIPRGTLGGAGFPILQRRRPR